MRLIPAVVGVLGFAALATSHTLAQSVVPAQIVLKSGDIPEGAGGQAVTSVNQPFTTKTGHVGFTGDLEIDDYLFFHDRVVWRDGFFPSETFGNVLDTSGVGDGGTFVLTSFFGGDAIIWDSTGLVARQFDPAPGFVGLDLAFLSRPEMTPNGTEYYIAAVADDGGFQTRLIYRRAPGGEPAVVLTGGEIVDGSVIAGVQGISFHFQVSDNNVFLVNSAETNDPDGSNEVVIRKSLGGGDAHIVAREGDPTGDGDNWRQFREVGVNNAGNWVAAARTSSVDNHQVLVHNGVPRVRNNGTTVAGVTLDDDWNIEAVSINNQDEIAFAFSSSFLDDHAVFVGPGATLPGSAALILRRNDLLDTNADGTGDWIVTEIDTGTSATQGIDLDDSGFIYLRVELTPADTKGENVEAVIRLATGGGCPGDWNGDGVTNSTDVSDLINDWFADQSNGTGVADWNGDGVVNSTDVSDFINAWFGTTGPGCGT